MPSRKRSFAKWALLAALATLFIPTVANALWVVWCSITVEETGHLNRIDDATSWVSDGVLGVSYDCQVTDTDSMGGGGAVIARWTTPIDNSVLPPMIIKGGKVDPVTGDGEFSQIVTDLSFPGEGLPFEFTRTYRSRAFALGNLGYSWDHDYETGTSPRSATAVCLPDGWRHGVGCEFLPDPSHPGRFAPDYRDKLSLETAPPSTSSTTSSPTGRRATRSYFGVDYLGSIASPYGYEITINWQEYSARSASAASSTRPGRTRSSTSDSPGEQLLQCLSLAPDCTRPARLVPLRLHAEGGGRRRALSVTKGNDAVGTSYLYHEGERRR